MVLLAAAALLGSAAIAYVIGYAFTAPRESFVRSRRGIWVLVVLGLTLLFLPPQLTALDASLSAVPGAAGMAPLADLAWPAAFSKGGYLAGWIVTSVAALLIGLRIWEAGTPGSRGGASRAYDASAASRASGLLPLADTLPDALDVLARAGLSERDVARVAADIREAGRRLADALPPSDGAVYSMVAAKVPTAIAGPVTGYLLEGAGRRGAKP
jgi:hypothetical protein